MGQQSSKVSSRPGDQQVIDKDPLSAEASERVSHVPAGANSTSKESVIADTATNTHKEPGQDAGTRLAADADSAPLTARELVGQALANGQSLPRAPATPTLEEATAKAAAHLFPELNKPTHTGPGKHKRFVLFITPIRSLRPPVASTP